MAQPDERFELAQAPIVRPEPIPRPEAIERPGSSRPNRFQKYAPPPAAASPQAVAPPANRFEKYAEPAPAVGMPEEPANPRLGFTNGLDMDAARKALESAPPEIRQKVLQEWEATRAAKPEEVSTPEDMAKSFGTGLIKGTVGMATLPSTAGQLADRLGAPEWLSGGITRVIGGALGQAVAQPKYGDVMKAVEDRTGPLYKPQTTAGEYSQTVGEFVPGGFGPGGVARKAANVLAPAIASETAGQLTKGGDYEGPARLAGGLAGAMVPNVAMRAVTPFPNVQPERARQVGVLEREGVPLTAGDRSGSKALRWAESAANDVPLSGRRIGAQKEAQGEAFTQAVLRRAGINAPRATDDVIDAAYNRLGQEFETIAQRTAIPLTPQLQGRLSNIVRAYERITEPSLINPLPREIAQDITQAYQRAGTFLPSYMDGARYSGWRSDIGRAARAAGDPRTERALYDIQHLLDNAAEQYLRSRGGWANQSLADRMREVRREYRNLITISKARGAGEEAAQGIINPRQLQQAARSMEGVQGFSRGRGEFTELAKAGVSVLAPLPNSGTPARLAAMSMFTAPATVAGLMVGGPAAGLASGIGTALSQGTMARALMSRPAQAYLGNQTLQRAAQNSMARTPIAFGAQSLTQPRDQ